MPFFDPLQDLERKVLADTEMNALTLTKEVTPVTPAEVTKMNSLQRATVCLKAGHLICSLWRDWSERSNWT